MPALPAACCPEPASAPPLPLVSDLLASPPLPVAVNPACSRSLHPISNEHFQGELMLKLRPADCHSQQRATAAGKTAGSSATCQSGAAVSGTDGSVSGAGHCACCHEFFSRYPSVQLELVVQGRFLRPVSGVWMGAELGGSPSPFTLTLPFLKRTLIKVMAGIIATFIPKVKWSLGDKRVGECPMIAFPLVSAMDCVLSSPLPSAGAGSGSGSGSGSGAPCVGWQRLSMAGSHRSSMSLDSEFDPSRLYTLGFFSEQLDLARWMAVNMNVPGVAELSLRSVWLDHPLTLLAYALIDKDGPHSSSNRHTLFAIQLQPPHTQQQQQRQQQHDKQELEEKESAYIG